MGSRWGVAATSVWGVAVLAGTACVPSGSSDSGTEPGDDGGADASVQLGDAGTLAGTFQVRVVAGYDGGAGATTVLGKVYDGPTPQLIVWEKASTSGDCTLLTPRVPFCATSCGGAAACVENDTCQPYPSSRSVGTVTVTGVRTSAGGTSLTMSPVVNAYQSTAALAYPPFAANDAITVSAAGAYYPAFQLQSRGVDPMQMVSGTLLLSSGQPLMLGWVAATAGSATVHIKLDISHHGGTKGMIECDTTDDGALDVPAALITQLVGLGVAGFPTVVVSRNAVGSTVIAPGRVDLVVTSEVESPLTLPGLYSCTSSVDCPDGGTCLADLTCQL